MSHKPDCCKLIIVKTDNSSVVTPATVKYVTNLLNEEPATNDVSSSANIVSSNGIPPNRSPENCRMSSSETRGEFETVEGQHLARNLNEVRVAVINRMDDLEEEMKSDRSIAAKRHKSVLYSIAMMFLIVVVLIILAIGYVVIQIAS